MQRDQPRYESVDGTPLSEFSPTPESRGVRSGSQSYSTDTFPVIKLTPQKKLVAAVLRRAVWDFALYRDVLKKNDPEKYQMAVDAAGWIFSDEQVKGALTFLYVCEVLGLDPGHIRNSTLALDRERVYQLVPDEDS